MRSLLDIVVLATRGIMFYLCTMNYVYLNYISVCLLSKEPCKHNLWLDYGPLCVVIVKLCAQMTDEID